MSDKRLRVQAAVRVGDIHCIQCGTLLSGASAVIESEKDDEEHYPKPGDATVCIECGLIQIYEGDPLGLRMPTSAEMRELKNAPAIEAILRGRASYEDYMELMSHMKKVVDDVSTETVPGGDARRDPGHGEERSDAPGGAGANGKREDEGRG